MNNRLLAVVVAAGLLAGGANLASYAADRGIDADTVDGNHARQLQTRSIVYRIPHLGEEDRFTLSLPGLHRRVYQVTYSVIAKMSAPGATISCYFRRAGSVYELLDYGTANAGYSTASAAGVLDRREAPLSFECWTTGGTAQVDYDVPGQSQIVFTPINRLGTATADIE